MSSIVAPIFVGDIFMVCRELCRSLEQSAAHERTMSLVTTTSATQRARQASRPMGDNGGARRDLSCCPWLLLWSLGALLLLRGSLLLPGSLLLLRADTPVQQVDARGLNASLIRGLNPFDENRPASAAFGSDRAAGMPSHARILARSR